MKEYLILISIGPVQDFIASARKLRDLWFGSMMLSELSKVVALSLYEADCEMIFPHIENSSDLEQDSDLIVANKIFVKYKGDKHPEELIENAKQSWLKAQVDFATIALNKIKQIKSINIDEALYEKQIGDSGEFFASWVKLGDDYKSSKDTLEKALAGRKNLRDFKVPAWDGSGIRKSSLDGARETVFIDKTPEINGLLKKNEYLDTLGCIKRFYPVATKMSKYFDDLSDIALIPYLHKIYKSNESEKLLSQYESCFNKNNGLRSINSRKHSKTELNIISDLLYATEGDLKHIPGAWNALRALLSNAGSPPKYACILLGDGDKMGVVLDQIKDYKGHQVFSKQLSVFAKKVESIIEEYDGSLIYAGGDDVMAYLPIHNAVYASNKVRKLFYDCIKKVFVELNLPKALIPTFSIGLGIVHHSYPLGKALDVARRAEKLAKNKGGRNALAIIQCKRSGSEISIYGKWEKENALGLYDRITKMIDMYIEEKSSLSHTLGYQLREAKNECGDFIEFQKINNELKPLNAAAVTVMRIFEQKLKCKNKTDESDNLKDLLNGAYSIKRLSDELVVVRQISEMIKMYKEENK